LQQKINKSVAKQEMKTNIEMNVEQKPKVIRSGKKQKENKQNGKNNQNKKHWLKISTNYDDDHNHNHNHKHKHNYNHTNANY